MLTETQSADLSPADEPTRFKVLGAISFSHFLNDMIQSLILAIYPLLKNDFSLSFVQIGCITLTYQITGSVLQPFIGMYTDRNPQPRALSVGMGFTLCGLVLLSLAPNYSTILLAAALVGAGSSIFHPESSRVARLASGGRHGLAQSIFQVGGNVGTALGPLLAAWIIIPYGRGSVAWFSLAALDRHGRAVQNRQLVLAHRARLAARAPAHARPGASSRGARVALVARDSRGAHVLEVSLPHKPQQLLHVLPDQQIPSVDPVRAAASVRLSLRDRAGHARRRSGRRPHRPKARHLGSILGVAPFTLLLPYADADVDERARVRDRTHHCFGVLRYPGLSRRSCCLARSARCRACSSASRSALAASGRRRSASSRTCAASNSSTACARSCR